MLEKMNYKVFFVNGPPGSGKDDACILMNNAYSYLSSVHTCFKQKLYTLTAELFSVDYDEFMTLATDRVLKELPIQTIQGMMSPRQMLMFTSENVVKPNMGKQYFGHALANYVDSEARRTLDEDERLYVYISDCGFTDEVAEVIKNLNLDNDDVVLIRIHREGYTYQNDSRSYISLPDGYTNTHDVYNNGTLEEFYQKIKDIQHSHIYGGVSHDKG